MRGDNHPQRERRAARRQCLRSQLRDAVDSDAKTRSYRGLLHGVRCVYRTGIGAGILESEEAEGRGQEGDPSAAGVYIVSAFFDTKW